MQDIRIGGRPSNAQFQFSLQSDDIAELREWEPKIRAALSKLPELADVNTDQQDMGLQTRVEIDRDAAFRLGGITPKMIDAALNDLFGQRQVSVIYRPLNQYRVVLEAAPEYTESPDTLERLTLTVPATATTPARQIALSNVARLFPEKRPWRLITKAPSSSRPCRSICRSACRCHRRRKRFSKRCSIWVFRAPFVARFREAPRHSRRR